MILWRIYRSEDVVMLPYAAGETKVQVPDYLKPPELNLKHLSREAIRKHVINIDPHQHLFGRIPQLGLSSSLSIYCTLCHWMVMMLMVSTNICFSLSVTHFRTG